MAENPNGAKNEIAYRLFNSKSRAIGNDTNDDTNDTKKKCTCLTSPMSNCQMENGEHDCSCGILEFCKRDEFHNHYCLKKFCVEELRHTVNNCLCFNCLIASRNR